MGTPVDCSKERFCNTGRQFRPNYGVEVLVGNWYEQRMRGKTDQKAITPGIYGKSGCLDSTTDYQENFKPHVQRNTPSGKKGIADFLETRSMAFRNRLRSIEINYKYVMDDAYLRNMTSMKDVKFRLEPLESADWPEHPLERPKPMDPLNRHGNLTETGLLGWMRCEEWREKQNRIDMSVYQNTYKPKTPVKPPKKCK